VLIPRRVLPPLLALLFMLGKKKSAIGLLARPTAPHHHVHCRRPFDASQYSYSDSKQIRHLHPRRHNNHLTRG
jgi:hypothetical protein